MITVTIDENTLLNMLVDRVENFTSDEDVIELYENYYSLLIDSGYFDDAELDIYYIVDNDYINNFYVISSDDFGQYNIEDENDSRIAISLKDKDLYLVEA